MKFGISVPHWGEYADARVLADLARDAEDAGWDGFYIWDHIAWGQSGIPMADATVALTAIALNTNQVLFGPMVTPLPRRRPTKVARETVSLDRLSGGRFVLGVGTGSGPDEFDNLGDEPNHRTRGAMLDEALDLLKQLWSGEPVNHEGKFYTAKETRFLPTPLQNPIPIWVAAGWPTKTPLKNDAPYHRAARYDCIFPIGRDIEWGSMLQPEHVRQIVDLVMSYRESSAPFEVATEGTSEGSTDRDLELVSRYEEAGTTWWVENIAPYRWDWKWEGPWPREVMRDRILAGPPVKR
jgi:hypothetical protein